MPQLQNLTLVPQVCANVWSMFWILHGTRGVNGYCPAAITFQEIQAYCNLTGEKLDPWEVHALNQLDGVYINKISKLMSKD